MRQLLSPVALSVGAIASSVGFAATATSSFAYMGLTGAKPEGQAAVVTVQSERVRPFEVRRRLTDRGYSDINVIRRQPPYRVEACRDGRLFELRINRRGLVRDRERIGQCGRTSRVDREVSLRRELRDRGFRRISVIRERRNAVVFEACKGFRRIRLVVERDGDIRRRRRVGFCERGRQARGTTPVVRVPTTPRASDGVAMNRRAVRDFLAERRYRKINIVEMRDGFAIAEGCRRLRKFRIGVNTDDRQIERRRRVGWCAPSSDGEVVRRRAVRPRIDFDARGRLRADVCQDAIEYLLDNDKIFFATASAELDDRSEPLLRRIARTANRCPGSSFVIGGHTDSRGSDSYNQDLSEARALSVARRLRRLGVPRNQLSAVGYGEDRPIASNGTERGRALNRRIEMLVEWDRQTALR